MGGEEANTATSGTCELLEDLFLKNQVYRSANDPFNKEGLGFTNRLNTTQNFTQSKILDTEISAATSNKYSRLPNGMIINNDVGDLRRQNDMLAKINAYIANNKAKNGEIKMPFGMIDSKSMAEFYSDLFSYAPCILKDAIHKGDEFERFKLTLKFAFSILHNLTF